MSTMKGTNHNKVVTVLLFYIKQHMHRKYSDDRPNTIISLRIMTLSFCFRTSLRGFLDFFFLGGRLYCGEF